MSNRGKGVGASQKTLGPWTCWYHALLNPWFSSGKWGFSAPKVGGLEAGGTRAVDIQDILEMLVESVEKTLRAQASVVWMKRDSLRRGLTV